MELNRREFLKLSAAYSAMGVSLLSVLQSHIPSLAFANEDNLADSLRNMSPDELRACGFDVYANFIRYRAVEELSGWVRGEILHGAIPSAICGSFLINSPNPYRFIENENAEANVHADRGPYHWFDGDGLVQVAKIKDGELQFIAKQTATKKIEFEQSNLDHNSDGLATGFGAALPGVDITKTNAYYMGGGNFETVDTANTTLTNHGGKLLANWYFGAGYPYEISGADFEYSKVYTFPIDEKADTETRRLASYTSTRMCAHSKVCPDSNELFYFSYFPSVAPRNPQASEIRNNAVYVSKISSEGKLLTSREFLLPGPRHIHDMALTENYIVVFDTPSRAPFGDYSTDDTRIGIVPRDFSEDIFWVKVESSYILHTCNAFETERGEIVLRATRVENTQNSEEYKDQDIPQIAHTVFKAHFYEWKISLANKTLIDENFVFDRELPANERTMTEFPVVAPKQSIRKNRYSYMLELERQKEIGLSTLIKVDHDSNIVEKVELQTAVSSAEPEGQFSQAMFYGSEAQFVADPLRYSISREDGGWLILFGSKEDLNLPAPVQSELWIFDAETLNLSARVKLPARMPKGFHSLWVEA